MSHFFTRCAFRSLQIVETTVVYRDGGFILFQVPPNGRYNHYLHNGYVAYLLYVA